MILCFVHPTVIINVLYYFFYFFFTHTTTGALAKKLKFHGSEQYWNRGISACAVCDGGLPIFRNRVVVVIGGGDTAMEVRELRLFLKLILFCCCLVHLLTHVHTVVSTIVDPFLLFFFFKSSSSSQKKKQGINIFNKICKKSHCDCKKRSTKFSRLQYYEKKSS